MGERCRCGRDKDSPVHNEAWAAPELYHKFEPEDAALAPTSEHSLKYQFPQAEKGGDQTETGNSRPVPVTPATHVEAGARVAGLTYAVTYDFLHQLWQATGSVPQGVNQICAGVYELCRNAYASIDDLFNRQMDEPAAEQGAEQWLLWNDVANPNTVGKRTIQVEVSQAIAQVLAHFPWNTGAKILGPILEAYAAHRTKGIEARLAEYTENRKIGDCIDCGGSIWFREAYMDEGQGKFHPLCRVSKRAEAAEARNMELMGERETFREAMRGLGMADHDVRGERVWRNARAEAAESHLAEAQKALEQIANLGDNFSHAKAREIAREALRAMLINTEESK